MALCLPHRGCCNPQTHIASADAHRSVGVHDFACRWTHVCAHMHSGSLKPVSRITPITLNSQRQNSQKQASWASLVLLANLLWGIPFSVFSGYNYKWSTAPTQQLQDFQASELQAYGPHVWVASASASEPSLQPCSRHLSARAHTHTHTHESCFSSLAKLYNVF